MDQEIILDNPTWHALQTAHKNFAIGTDNIKKYPSNILRIMGCENPARANLSEIEPWLAPGEKSIIIGELPPIPANWKVFAKLDCLQMTCGGPIKPKIKSDMEIVQLHEADRRELFELVDLVQPGYFDIDTPSLGRYFGIRHNGKLISAAGERICIEGLTEISAVVTHPDFTGKGYAQQLIAHAGNLNIDEGKSLFLHLLASNTRARGVYELLGFTVRRPIMISVIAAA